LVNASIENAPELPACPAIEDERRSRFLLDGDAPDFVFAPGSEAECVEVVKWAAAAGCALVPWGGGTAVQQGNRLRASRWAALSTAGLAQRGEYSPDDMVVTAQAGLTLATLQDELGKQRQFLPIDAPCPDRAALGGIVATNAQGLWRPAFGAPRDRLLGVRVVMPDGAVVKGGGKVVKNVAGYDLCKLFAGSWGTLGLITEVTFKTNPLPEARAHAVFTAPGLRVAVTAALIVHAARLQPVYMTAVSAPSPALCVGMHGSAQAVTWQEAEIARLLESEGLRRTADGPTEEQLRHLITNSPAPLKARITARPSFLPEIVEGLCESAELIVCHVPTGIVEAAFTAMPDPSTINPQPSTRVLVWTRVPPDRKASMDIWGPTRGDFGLMRGIKRTFDPNGLFSPGRFVGRL
jgi:glycolate oxidase FAD binding subunit